LLIFLLAVNVIVVAAVVWLFIEHKKLKQQLTVLTDEAERNNKDIAGLCSAAVSVDKRLLDNCGQLNDIVEKVSGLEQHEHEYMPESDDNQQQPYQNAIQLVKNGATAEELIQHCGLSRDEAVLLIRLHG